MNEEVSRMYCPKCGGEMMDDANFCRICGAALRGGEFHGSFDERVDRFAKQMEKFGNEAGRVAEKYARQFSNEVERMTRGTSICPNCSASFPGRHNFCGKCGTEIK
jgi:predicted amidophosphoribosyltransferase